VRPVGLVGRGHDHPCAGIVLAHRLEQHVRAADVRLPGAERRVVGLADLGLCGQVEDRVRPMLPEGIAE
jgi:hypothetical protein